MIKIEFPADRLDIAKALGEALLSLSTAAASLIDESGPDESYKIVKRHNENVDAEFGNFVTPDESEDAEEPKTPPSSLFDRAEDSAPAPQPTDQRVDQHGVVFNPEFCGKATEPFYKSGAMSGQWKKKKGVSQEAYDGWYASSRPTKPVAETPPPAVDTKAAFGAATSTPTPIVTDVNSLMVWISEQQAAQRLTQEQVQAAYPAMGVQMMDMFPGNGITEEKAAESVRKIHNHLTQVSRGNV